jgi:hypothetical protein
VPIHNGDQIQEPSAHGRIGNIRAPTDRQHMLACVREELGADAPPADLSAGRDTSCALSQANWC